MSLLSIHQISKIFPDHDTFVHAVVNVSLELPAGKMVAIVGPSGSGKTTLLNIMGLLIPPDAGQVIVDGHETKDLTDRKRCRMRNKYFGYIVQDFALIETETALKNILVPTLYTEDRQPARAYRPLIEAVSEHLQIQDKLHRKVSQLSGGERQRVAIIRSIVCGQRIILADEPTGSLDQDNAKIVVSYLRQLVDEEEKTVVLVTHDLHLASQCDLIYQLKGGQLSPASLNLDDLEYLLK